MTAQTRLPSAFTRLAYSNLFAQFSEQVALAAAPLVAVILLGATASDTGILQTAQTLPFLLLSIPIGVLADRASRRRIMAGSEALRALSLVGILLLLVLGKLTLLLLAVLGFAGAVGTVCYNVAAPALVPGIVPRSDLTAANRWLELARSAAFMAGPAVGGAFVGWMGAPSSYVLATALSLLAVILLSGLREPATAPRARRNPLQELRDGARFLAAHAYLRPILITALVFNASWFVLQAVYVAFAVTHLGLTASGVGATMGMYGAGMVVGALLATRLARHLRYGSMIATGPLCALAASAIMLSTIRYPSGIAAGVSFFLFGAGPILWTITTTTLRQSVTPGPMLGRVSALILTATMGARPIGAAIGALVAAKFGVEACLVASFAGFLVQCLVLVASPVRGLAQLPDAA